MTSRLHRTESSRQNRQCALLAGFASVGAVATAAQYVVLAALVTLANLRPALASSIGFGLSALLNYQLNYRYTFRSTAAHSAALPRFVAMVILGLALNTLLMWQLTERLRVHYLLAQVFSTGIVLLWNFWVSSRWIFRR